jgi:hypothetical protein
MDKEQPVTGGEQEPVADGEDQEAPDGPQDITMSGSLALPKLGAGSGE